MTTGNDVQAAFLANMKSKTAITSLLASSGSIKERQWQGQDFVYPAIRLSVDFYPAVNRCLHRAEIIVTVFSEEKSSDQASSLAAAIQNAYHGIPFKQSGIQFPTVIVSRVDRPDRSIYCWESNVHLNVQVS